MDIALIVIAGICMLVALIGCVLPALPGPLLAYAGFLMLHFTEAFEFETKHLVIATVLTALCIVLDYVMPSWCTKRFGGSKWGAWGSIVGLIAGLIFPIPGGFIVGTFLGAVVGELMSGRNNRDALKSGIGSFVGFILSTGLKLAVVIGFCWVYVKYVWSLLFP